MGYLEPAEYVQYGLEEETSDGIIEQASAMIDAFCRRPGLGVQTYTERLHVAPRSGTVRVSALPMLAITRIRARFGRVFDPFACHPMATEIAAFCPPGSWTDLDAAAVEFSSAGEVTLPVHLFGSPFEEVEIAYTAGFVEVPDAIKIACAQIVRNAEAMPALNVKRSSMDAMQMEYFSGALLDDEVKRLLSGYVATRMSA